MRKKLYHLLVISTRQRSMTGKYLAYFISILILLNVVAVILETVPYLQSRYGEFFYYFELFSVLIFSLEYLLRLWVCVEEPLYSHSVKGRLKYLVTPLALIDLLAILPFYLPFLFALDLRTLRMLRLFRVFRLLKLSRYMKAMRILVEVLRGKKEELILTAVVVFTLMIIASSLMYAVENEAQPEAFSSIPETMWWAVITLTTVGYGDVYPITIAGRTIGAIISIIGVGLIAMPAAIIASGFVERISKQEKKVIKCPHCGQKFVPTAD